MNNVKNYDMVVHGHNNYKSLKALQNTLEKILRDFSYAEIFGDSVLIVTDERVRKEFEKMLKEEDDGNVD